MPQDRQPKGPVEIKTFSYDKGVPGDYDLLIDVRGLKNPWNDPTLKWLDGTDEKVQDYLKTDERLHGFLLTALRTCAFNRPATGRYELWIGCQGGRHRSVAFAELLREHLRRVQITCWITHTARWTWKTEKEQANNEKKRVTIMVTRQ